MNKPRPNHGSPLLVLFSVAVVGSATLAAASPAIQTFVAGEPIVAADINANFATLDEAISSLGTVLDERVRALRAATPMVPPWTDYDASVSVAVGPVTTQTTTAKQRRVGDTVEINIVTVFTSCAAAGVLRWSLPTGLLTDGAKLPGTNAFVGTGMMVDTSVYPWMLSSLTVTSQGSVDYVALDPTNGTAGGLSCNTLGNGPREVRLRFSLPIQGWSATE